MQRDIVHAHRTIQTILAQQKELPPNVYNAKVPNPLSIRTSLLFFEIRAILSKGSGISMHARAH